MHSPQAPLRCRARGALRNPLSGDLAVQTMTERSRGQACAPGLPKEGAGPGAQGEATTLTRTRTLPRAPGEAGGAGSVLSAGGRRLVSPGSPAAASFLLTVSIRAPATELPGTAGPQAEGAPGLRGPRARRLREAEQPGGWGSDVAPAAGPTAPCSPASRGHSTAAGLPELSPLATRGKEMCRLSGQGPGFPGGPSAPWTCQVGSRPSVRQEKPQARGVEAPP